MLYGIEGDINLDDLNAHLIGDYNVEDGGFVEIDNLDAAQGVMFQCPKCAQGKEIDEEEYEDGSRKRMVRGAHYVICWFKNPRRARQVPDVADPKPGRWVAWGTNIADLTLTPSVHLSGKGCGWHGFVRDGIATLV